MYDKYEKREEIMGVDWEALLQQGPARLELERLKPELSRFVLWWKKKVEQNHLTKEQFDEMFKRGMYFVGLDYTINDWNITITSADRFQRKFFGSEKLAA